MIRAVMTDRERIERAKRLLAHPLTVVTRPVWISADGWLRIGRTDDMIAMLDDLGIRSRA